MIQILGWTILHSLWQVALIASIYLIIKHSWQAVTASKKYYLAVASLVTTFLSTIFTFNYLYQQEKWTITAITDSTLSPITSEIPTATSTPIIPNELILETNLSFADYLTVCLPYLVMFWGIGLLYFTIRFLKNLYGVNKLQNVDNELIGGEWLAKINTFKIQLNIEKEVQVFLSLHVKEPITFGHFKPIILLPISLITGFDSAAIETILLHELAHIKRHDYLVNLGQSIIEIILFYHPLIWWLSKDIRELREHCCDDLVLSLGDNRATYVETLTALQWRKVGGVTNRLSLSASGGDAGFTRRIKRMFGVEEKRGSFRQLMGVFFVLLVFAVGGIWLKNEWSIPAKMSLDKTFIVHKNTTLSELNELAQEMRDLGIYKSFCWSGYYDEITSINGAYYDVARNIQYFDITDIRKTPTQFIFENGFITAISDLPYQSIQLKSAKDASHLINDAIIKERELRQKDTFFYTILINDKTTKAELNQWAKMVTDQGIQFDFKGTTFDEQKKIVEVRGNYKTEEKGGDFYGRLPCVNVTFELYKDQLSEAIFSYPCRGKSIGQVDIDSISVDDLSANPIKKEKGQIYWIDEKTFVNDKESIITELSGLGIFDGFSFNQETNSFNGSYFFKKGETNYIEVEDVAKRPIKIVIKNGYVTELKITGDVKDGIGFIRNDLLDKAFPNQFSSRDWGINNDTLVYLVSNEMTRIELYDMIAKVYAHSQVRINLDPLKTKFDKQDKLVTISGKYYYERPNRTPIQTFEVADLGQFQLQFKSHQTISFAPAYYNSATNQFIQVEDNYSALGTFARDAISKDGVLIVPTRTYKDIYATLVINESTNIDDLKIFAEKILPNNIIFRYQDSKFRPDGTIAKLVGDFLGNSRISEPFYVDDLTKHQVKLRVDKDYIYQPEITSIAKKKLSSRTNNSLKQDYEISLLQATNEKERIFWRERLAALEINSERFNSKGYTNFKPNSLNAKANVETENPGLSYKITNWKALNLDSLEYSLADQTNQNYGNGIAKLIPSYVAVGDSVKAMNPIYRVNMEKAKPVFVNGEKIAKKDLPTFMENHLQEAINIDIPKTKRHPKTDTTVDWLYWGDQKINLGAAYKKDENGELKWDAPKLEISKEVWNRNKDRPFIFQVGGDWYRVKDFDMIVLVPHKEDPMSVTFNKDYAKALRNKETSIFKLFAKVKENNQLYFEKLDIGLPIKIFMMVEITENNSTGFIPKVEELKEQSNKTKPALAVVVGRKDREIDNSLTIGKVSVSNERNKPLPTIGMNSPNRVHWDNLEFKVQATVKERINEEKTIQISTLEITQAQWERLYNQPFSLDFNNNWYSVKTVKEIVHVPFKKDPSAASLHKSYIQIIKNETHRATKLLTKAKVNDYIYFEEIGVGEKFTFGMVVKIVENQPKHSIK